MKVKVLRSTTASGKDLLEGKTYDVSDSDGRLLVLLGKAEEVEQKAKPGSQTPTPNPPPPPAS